MYQIFSTKFLIFIIAFYLGLLFMAGVALATILNCIFKTPPNRHLVSSGIIAAISYMAMTGFLLYALPSSDWSNGEPQGWSAFLSNNIEIISGLVSLVCFVGWQIAARRRQLR